METSRQINYALILIALVCIIYVAYILAPRAIVNAANPPKPYLDSCNNLTNATYDNYSNSNWCVFNGTGWEPMLWGNSRANLKERI